MDPQQRIMLEIAWEALERAGYNPLTSEGAIGMYAGAVLNTYLLNNIHSQRHQLDSNDDLRLVTPDSLGGFQLMIANDKDYLTTRVSYKLNLTGPSVNVQTACSTALVAIHLACQSLQSGESDMVLAGGISVQVPQKIGHLYQDGMMVSPDGHCRAFDRSAQGTIFGSGAGLVLLKRLDEALADGDQIYAVIKGTALNNDGGMKVGYMAPRGDGQAAVVSEAIAMAGVEAETITYVEAHGTGTILGDPIEVGGLTQAFRHWTNKKNFCALGSVKSNVGHLQIASGIVGFIKSVLCLHHKTLVPTLHFEQPNPQIDFPNTPFYVNTSLKAWHTNGTPRRAGVNSLGIGGANVHVILEEAPARQQEKPQPVQDQPPQQLLTLSAKNEQALGELAARMVGFLSSHPDTSLADICFTANTGRAHFEQRLAVMADSTSELHQQLARTLAGEETFGVIKGDSRASRPQIAFLFSGQGSQYVGMGRDFYQSQPIFREVLDHCDELLRPMLDKSLLEILYPTEREDQEDEAAIHETIYTQPALFAFEYALANLWLSWGIRPDVVMGHSVGEVVAACVAGVFSLEDGLKLIVERARLMQECERGQMVAVFADQSLVQALIAPYSDSLSIAAINGPENVVISGHPQPMAQVIERLTRQGIKSKRLKVSHAFHSPLMMPMLADFERVARSLRYDLPQIELVSNLTGQVTSAELATPEYWVRHVRQPVRFGESMETLKGLRCEVFVEIGPKATLLAMGRRCLAEDYGLWLRSESWTSLLSTLGELYVRGIEVDWTTFFAQQAPNLAFRRVLLPTYPWQRERYWIERAQGDTNKPHEVEPSQHHPLLHKKIALPLLKDAFFESRFSTDSVPLLADHRVYGQVIVPSACHISALLAAAAEHFGQEGTVLEDILFTQALIIPDGQARTVQVALMGEPSSDAPVDGPSNVQSVKVISQVAANIKAGADSKAAWDLHLTGNIYPLPPNHVAETISLEALQRRCQHSQMDSRQLYEALRSRKIELGPSFKWLSSIWIGKDEVLCQLNVPQGLSLVDAYQLHPGIVDASFHLLTAMLPEDVTFVPLRIEKFAFYGRPSPLDLAAGSLWSHATLHTAAESAADVLEGEIRLFSAPDEQAAGQLIAKATGFTVKKVSREVLLDMPTSSLASSAASDLPEASDGGMAFLQQLKALPASEHQALLEAEVRTLVGQVLGLNQSTPLDEALGFFELGMDSLSSLELRNRLQNRLGCVLHMTFAFDYPNLKSLVAYLASQLLDQQASSFRIATRSTSATRR